MDSLGISIVIPIYNEVKAVAELKELLEATSEKLNILHEFIIVDDGSNDGTPQILSELSKYFSNHRILVRFIAHAENTGYGAALKTGITAAQFPWIAITDCDGTYPTPRVAEFLEIAQSQNFDMVVGSRHTKDANIPLIRRPAKAFLNLVANFSTGRIIPDLNSGFRIFTKELALRFYHLYPDGFSFTSTITLASLHSGLRVLYVPIVYLKRAGVSKIRPIRDTLGFLQLTVRITVYFNPLRFFLPVSVFIFFVAAIVMAMDLREGKLNDSTTIIVVCGLIIFSFALISDQLNTLRKELQDVRVRENRKK